jgi:hypothetical protein
MTSAMHGRDAEAAARGGDRGWAAEASAARPRTS